MASLKQIEANRRNAQKSTGPTSLAGKQTVGQNAIQHGLLTASPVVFPEEQEPFDNLTEQVRYEYQPEGVREQLMVTRIIDCLWRLQRASRVEAGIFVVSHQKELEEQANRESTPYVNAIEQRNPGAASLGAAYIRNAGVLARLSRHERHIERSYQAAVQELRSLQYARTMQCDPFFVTNMRKFPAIDLTVAKQKHEGQYRSGPLKYPNLPGHLVEQPVQDFGKPLPGSRDPNGDDLIRPNEGDEEIALGKQ